MGTVESSNIRAEDYFYESKLSKKPGKVKETLYRCVPTIVGLANAKYASKLSKAARISFQSDVVSLIDRLALPELNFGSRTAEDYSVLVGFALAKATKAHRETAAEGLMHEKARMVRRGNKVIFVVTEKPSDQEAFKKSFRHLLKAGDETVILSEPEYARLEEFAKELQKALDELFASLKEESKKPSEKVITGISGSVAVPPKVLRFAVAAHVAALRVLIEADTLRNARKQQKRFEKVLQEERRVAEDERKAEEKKKEQDFRVLMRRILKEEIEKFELARKWS